MDVDDLVETAAGLPVAEIFATEGESGFRARERTALATDLIASYSAPYVSDRSPSRTAIRSGHAPASSRKTSRSDRSRNSGNTAVRRQGVVAPRSTIRHRTYRDRVVIHRVVAQHLVRVTAMQFVVLRATRLEALDASASARLDDASRAASGARR